MSRLSVLAILCTVTIATPLAARLSASSRQSPTPSADATVTGSPQGRATTPPLPPPPPAATPPQPNGPVVRSNVRVDLRIVETLAGATTNKNVELITSSGSRGSIRSGMHTSSEGDIALDVDARPTADVDGRIQLELIFAYTPQRAVDAAEGVRSTNLTEQLNLFLTDGKPQVVSQSADPRGDRKVTVEVTATIMK
jgi:hypothetical protein